VKLDLGSGPNPHEGFTGVDKYDAGPDGILADLQEFPWPFEDESVDEVWCSHYIEHAPRELWCAFVNELHRVLKPEAKATIMHPNVKSHRAFQDPWHVDFIPPERWAYADKTWRVANGLDREPYPTCDFELAAFNWVGVQPDLLARSDLAKQNGVTHWWEGAADVMVVLKKR